MNRGIAVAHRVRFGSAHVIGVLAMALLAACGSDDADSSSRAQPETPPARTVPSLIAPPRSSRPVFTGEAAEVERAFLARVAAFADRDSDAVLASSTGDSSPDSVGEILNFMDNFAIRVYRITDIDVKGDVAVVLYENAIVGRELPDTAVTTLLGQRETWMREDGVWKLSSSKVSAPGIPRDLATVKVQLRDGAAPVIAEIPDREFGFRLENRGAAPKGTFLLAIPTEFDLDDLIPLLDSVGLRREVGAAQFPPGFSELGATVDVEAGGAGTMVFSGPLPAGRYVLVTPAEGDDGAVLPGEYVEFTIR